MSFEILNITILIVIILAGTIIKFPFLLNSTGDDWVSNYVIDKKTLKPSISLDKSIFPLILYYPPLHYYFISLFKKQNRYLIGSLLNLIYDAISTIIIYIFTQYYFSYYFNMNDVAANYALVSSALFIFSPLITPIHARIQGLKTRSLGTLVSIIYFISLYCFIKEENYLFFVFSILIGLLSFTCSQMAYQNITFISITLSLISLSIKPIIILILIILISLLIPNFNIFDIILHKYKHFKWYIKNLNDSPIRERGNIKSLIKSFNLIKNKKYLSAFIELLIHNPIIIALLSAPHIFYIISDQLIKGDINTIMNSNFSLASYLALSGFIIFLVTSIKPFIVAGESERYLECVHPFFTLVFIHIYSSNLDFYKIIFVFLLMNIIIIITNLIIIERNRYYYNLYQINNDNIEDLLTFINNHNIKEKSIATDPPKLAFLLSTHIKGQNLKFLYGFGDDLKNGWEWMNNYFDSYNELKSDLNWYKTHSGIHYIVVYKKYINSNKYKDYKIIYSTDSFNVILL
jgi:hypothetical protein